MARRLLLMTAAWAAATVALAQTKPAADPERVERAVRESFRVTGPEWQGRLVPDETMRQCSAHGNSPPQAIVESIQEREKTTIHYPGDGQFLGKWKNGEKIAQSGYGLRFTDYPPRAPYGGNCYACHELTKQEVSYGTIGPSLLRYGKLREFTPEAVKAAYEKIYNPHATFACSLMPRFGSNQVLTVDQIKDLVALLMDPESPVNRD